MKRPDEGLHRVWFDDRWYDVPPEVVLDAGYGDIHLTGTIVTTGERPGLTLLTVYADSPLSPRDMCNMPWARLMESAIAHAAGKPYRASILDHAS